MKRSRINQSEEEETVEASTEEDTSSCEKESDTSLASSVVGHIDNGKGFHYADIAFANPSVVHQSFSLFVIDQCYAEPLTRAWGSRSANWHIVDNINERALIIQHNIPALIYIGHGNKPTIVSTTETMPCPLPNAMWMHGSTPLDQEMLAGYYRNIMDEVLIDSYHREHAKVYLVLSLVPLKLLYLKW